MNTATLRTLACAVLWGCAANAAPADEERVTRGAEGFASEHAPDELRNPATLEERPARPNVLATKPRVRAHSAGAAALLVGDSWIYDAFTDTFRDDDRDGYFHYLRVRFDVDTSHKYRYVYAVIYISADGNAWEHIYSTDDFAVWGASPDDDYEVETELVTGYSTGLYDVLIELYDADTEVLVDEFGPNESSEFSLLPLEDSVRDGVPPPPPPPAPPVIVEDGGGGATSWLMLAGLALAALGRRGLRLGRR